MILCAVSDVEPGAVLGAAVLNPRAPESQLLRPGVALDAALIRRMNEIGVRQIWIQDDFSDDLDLAVGADLEAGKVALYTALKEDLKGVAQRTITSASVLKFKRTVVEMVLQLMTHAGFAGLIDQIFGADRSILTHATNVAYLSLVTGLELQTYILRQRSRLDRDHARDLSSMGIGAMLHDVGKLGLGKKMESFHEVCADLDDPVRRMRNAPEGYENHPRAGHMMLKHASIPATTSQIVLNHHQRYDGSGWPEIRKVTSEAVAADPKDEVTPDSGKMHFEENRNTQRGDNIHVLVRIVAAANVLDNLLYDGQCADRPPIAALSEFASSKYDGWFDPVVRSAVLRRVPPFAVGSLVTLDDGRKAIVAVPNAVDPCRPAVRITTGDVQTGKELLDLARYQERRIVRYLGMSINRWHYTIPEREKLKSTAAA